MSERVDVVVVGAGVVGLAVARALALRGRETLVLEQHDAFGTETSARNSEVIHAGIYYRPGGLRAKLCHPGKEMLYAYARERGVPFDNCGKFVVAHDASEIGKLDALMAVARANGVVDLERISGAEACALEPELDCVSAIWSPSSGIIDSHSLMLALLGDLENAGGALVLEAPVVGGAAENGRIRIDVGGAGAMSLDAGLVINSAGLHAERVARSLAGLDPAFIPAIRPAKGQYFIYSGKAPFHRLIYPLHTADSQGVHYSRDLGGQARLGPDISWDAPLGDYSVDESRLDMFADAARRFWPGLDRGRLIPGYAGQRPKASGPGEEGDYRILGPDAHGTPGYIGLYAIESPGLTSCLSIGAHVADLAERLVA